LTWHTNWVTDARWTTIGVNLVTPGADNDFVASHVTNWCCFAQSVWSWARGLAACRELNATLLKIATRHALARIANTLARAAVVAVQHIAFRAGHFTQARSSAHSRYALSVWRWPCTRSLALTDWNLYRARLVFTARHVLARAG
jgi:hypothetical protein